jgi:hypothetical protein
VTALVEPRRDLGEPAPAVRAPADDLPARRAEPRRREALLAFGLAFAAYVAAGWTLAVRHHAIVGDAMARVANAYYVTSSRDPHLAAIGFVWNPLPSLAEIPVLALHPLFPALRTQAFAGNLVSAAFMAGAVALVLVMLRELGVGRAARVALTVVFAAHPLILLYAANGDSEASLVFFLCLTCLGLLRWWDRRDLPSLVLLGLALGLGYLSRQEFLLAGALVVVTVAVATYHRARGARRHRAWSAATEGTLTGLPFGFAIAAWALSAWILVGTPMSYFDVNRAQVAGARVGIDLAAGGSGVTQRLAYVGEQLVRVEPLGAVIVGLAVVVALRRRDARILAPLVTFGAVLVTQVGLFGLGSTFGWLRFSITAVPLTVLAAGFLLGPRRRRPHSARAGWAVAGAVLVLALVAALPTAAGAMADPRLGREEAGLVGLLPGYGWAAGHGGAYASGDYRGFDRAARYFDRRHLRHGAVVVDAQYSFPLVLKSAHPQQFVIPSDRDFERTLADPATYRARYLLVSDGAADAVAASYPELRSTRRTPIAELVRTFRAGPNHLRLYRVTGSVTGSTVRPTRG